MQINPLPGVRFMETFWNSPSPAESLKTIKPFDGFFCGSVILDHRLTRLMFLADDAVRSLWMCTDLVAGVRFPASAVEMESSSFDLLGRIDC